MISTEVGEINANLCKDQAVPNKAVMPGICGDTYSDRYLSALVYTLETSTSLGHWF